MVVKLTMNQLVRKALQGNLLEATLSKKAEDLAEAYSVELKDVKNHEYILVNTSGKVIDNKGKNKDGSDYYYVTDSNGKITNIYVED